jgi:hypothetical protein
MLGIKGFSKKDTSRWTKINVPAPAEVIGSKFSTVFSGGNAV